MSSVIESVGKGVSGHWVSWHGLLGQLSRESLGIGSGGKGSKSNDNLGLSQNWVARMSSVNGSGGKGASGYWIRWQGY